jgi:hypothetical protein
MSWKIFMRILGYTKWRIIFTDGDVHRAYPKNRVNDHKVAGRGF